MLWFPLSHSLLTLTSILVFVQMSILSFQFLTKMVQSGNYGITAFRLPNTPSESYSKEETRQTNMTEYEVKLYCFQ